MSRIMHSLSKNQWVWGSGNCIQPKEPRFVFLLVQGLNVSHCFEQKLLAHYDMSDEIAIPNEAAR